MSKTNKTTRGGDTMPKTAPTSRKNGFNPLIATSLALALGFNVGTAQDIPAITINGTIKAGTSNLAEWKANGDYISVFNKDNGKGVFENFRMQFQNSSEGSADASLDENKTYEILARNTGDTNKAPTFDFNTTRTSKGLKMGAEGKGSFIIGLNTTKNDAMLKKAKATLNFGGKTNDVALWGNLVIQGGDTKPSAYQDGEIPVTATFAGNLKGDLMLNEAYSFIPRAKVTFNSGNLDGNIQNVGYLDLTLTSGKITGGITTKHFGNNQGTESGYSKITLQDVSASIDGDILVSQGGSGATSPKNEIIFSAGGSIGSSAKSSLIQASAGTNSITFSTGTATIASSKLLAKDGWGNSANIIDASGANANFTFGSIATETANANSKSNSIKAKSGTITVNEGITTAGGNHKTEIAFKESGTLDVNGDILTTGSATFTFGEIPASSQSTANEALATGDFALNAQNITADIGTNTITFKGGTATLKVAGALLATSGAETKNIINASTSNVNFSFGSIKTTENYNAEKSNTITAQTGTITIGSLTTGEKWHSTPKTDHKNTITFKESGAIHIKSNVFTQLGTTSFSFGEAKREFNTDGTRTVGNSLKIDSGISTVGGGKVYIGKTATDSTSALQTALGNNFAQGITSDANAYTGSLNIQGGISSTGGGWTNIAFKADSTQATSAISSIDKEQKKLLKAVEGNNNLYLDFSGVTLSRNLKNSIILGDIDNQNGGTNNIILKGKQSDGTIGLTGNIATNGGSNNIIFDESVWTPTNLSDSLSGNLTTTQGGVSNLVLRQTDSNAQSLGYPALFNVIMDANSKSNIVVQGPANIGANITYQNGSEATFIFAGNNDSASDTFGSNATDISNNKVLGKTYQDGVKLTLRDINIKVGDKSQSFIDTYGHYFRGSGDSLLTLTTQRVNSANKSAFTQTDTITLKGLAVGSIDALGASTSSDGALISYAYNVTLDRSSAFVGSINLQKDSKIDLTMKQGSKLFTNASKLTLKTLKIEDATFDPSGVPLSSFAQGNTIIDIATMGNDLGNIATREDFRLALIGSKNANTANTGLVGSNALFRVYVNDKADQIKATLGEVKAQNSIAKTIGTYGYAYADRVIVYNTGDNSKSSTHYLQAVYDNTTDLSSIAYHGGGTEKEGNIAVATVRNQTGSQPTILFKPADTVQGFDQIGSEFEAVVTDENGKVASQAQSGDTYTTYFLKSAGSKGASKAIQEATSSALGINYDLFLANFNSLNKRMGELRDNNHSQGAWGRIFNGMLSTSYGLQTQSIYTTIQAGYDYAFGFEGANNYLGVALSYANSVVTPKNKIDLNGSATGIDKTLSNAVEIAVYNSYVQDSGWFNDTIMKFSYIASDLNMSGQSTNYNTQNFGVVLSDEFGYRFKLGNAKEWYIDPQLELGFGYFNQSNLKQVLGGASLNGIQEQILTLRTRVGASFGYDFKNFTKDKGINASVYIGTFYSYDYIHGGDITLTTNLGKTTALTDLSSTGRFDLNLGTNLTIQENTRIYFDFERSFGGKITTEYQINAGVRYSFGENTGYKPISQTPSQRENYEMPLKIKEEQENKTEAKEAQKK